MQSPHNLHHVKILKAPNEFSSSLNFLRSCVPFTPSHGLTVRKFRHLAVQKFERQKSKIFQLCYTMQLNTIRQKTQTISRRFF